MQLVERSDVVVEGRGGEGLVAMAQEPLQSQDRGADRETPKWIMPVLLFFMRWEIGCVCVFVHLYLQVVLAMRRLEEMADIWSTNWKWFGVGASKWEGYRTSWIGFSLI